MLAIRNGLILGVALVLLAGGQWAGWAVGAKGEREASAPAPPTRVVRRTPIVQAVQKTRQGVLTIRVVKPTGYGGKRDVVGTGVIVDERGYAVTNNHVIRDASSVRVEMADGTSLRAEVVTALPRSDLAVLKLQGSGRFQALEFGAGSDLMVGETVIAVGNPLGFTNTVSTGIVSALGREIELAGGDVALTNLIQTNASINQGNSGGPLLNINGQVIGINVAIREGAQGIAFAINADDVVRTLAKTLSAARIAGVRHGLAVKQAASGDGNRVVVDQVIAGSPAEKAGLKAGDVIVQFGSRRITNVFDVERAFWGYRNGEQVPALVQRAGGEARLSLVLGAVAPAPAPGAVRLPGIRR